MANSNSLRQFLLLSSAVLPRRLLRDSWHSDAQRFQEGWRWRRTIELREQVLLQLGEGGGAFDRLVRGEKAVLEDDSDMGNKRSTVARVVDECDSSNGCDEEHGYQPPCRNNIVDASSAVWTALGVTGDSQGDDLSVTWAMA